MASLCTLLLTAVGISELAGGIYLVRCGELMQALAVPRAN